MEKKNYIYIILSDTGTRFTKCIQMYTKAPYNHVSIALDANLEYVYSFGRKEPDNPFIGGFVKEDMREGKLFRHAKVAIYRCPVTANQYERLRVLLHRFHQHAHLFKYNFIGLFGVMFRYPLKRKRAYFCSQFVSYLMKEIDVPLVAKKAELTTPKDIQQSPILEAIYEGKLSAYFDHHSSYVAENHLSVFPIRKTQYTTPV